MHYTQVPDLVAYIDRIGATEVNFRKFVVKDVTGRYAKVVATVSINRDGAIQCDNQEYAPTDDEKAAINEALAKVSFPKHVKATSANPLRHTLGHDAQLFEFWDRSDDMLIMAQQRVDTPTGKNYVPWTFWSDGEWRRMQPECKLPFWKPRKPRNKLYLMIHEGAKAASHIDQMLNDPLMAEERARHPWSDELDRYEHWGMIGGTNAVKNVDFASIRAFGPETVVYVADNDWEGKNAVAEISRCYGKALQAIYFDETFPPSWDMADPLPKDMFTDGEYTGHPLSHFMKAATMATKLIPNPDGGKPTAAIRPEFTREWVHSVKPQAFIHKAWPSRMHTRDEFNNLVAPYSHVDDTARLMRKDDVGKGTIVKYDPSKRSGVFSSHEGRFINTFVPSPVRPVKGGIELWTEFLVHLFPIEKDRIAMMRWIATLVARPDIRMTYGILLISETQGVGKSTLGEKILAPLVGKENVSFPNETEVCNKDYNYWIVHKRLAVIHEIYAGQSSKAYNLLKEVITDTTTTAKMKFLANYQIDVWVHVFACSNSMKALKLPDEDRRWFVPTVAEDALSHAYWAAFNRWLQKGHGLRAIRWWADDWLKSNRPVPPGAIAPESSRKKEVVEESMSDGQKLVHNFLSLALEKKKGERMLIIDRHLVDLIKSVIYEGRKVDHLEKPATVRRIAKRLGFHVCKTRANIKEWGTAFEGAQLICSHKDDAAKTPGQLLTEGLAPLDVMQFYKSASAM